VDSRVTSVGPLISPFQRVYPSSANTKKPEDDECLDHKPDSATPYHGTGSGGPFNGASDSTVQKTYIFEFETELDVDEFVGNLSRTVPSADSVTLERVGDPPCFRVCITAPDSEKFEGVYTETRGSAPGSVFEVHYKTEHLTPSE